MPVDLVQLNFSEVPYQYLTFSMLYDPPENALQGLSGRVLSEHELRVQRSLQRLNVPDWYKNNARPTEPGFLLRSHGSSRRGWPGLTGKTTSLSSLGRSPSGCLGTSPSPPPAALTRWSSSRVHATPRGTPRGTPHATPQATPPSTSPCGSARSSFNHRQPYLGWRSQERLACPRTPAERLAQGLLPVSQPQPHPADTLTNQVVAAPSLTEVRTSIKEVTSAIVHYVSSKNPRLCWLESSFVGSRPLDSDSYSDTYPDTYPDTCPDTYPDSCPDTCPDACPDTCPDTRPDTCPSQPDLHKRGAAPAGPAEMYTHHDNNNQPSKRSSAYTRKRNWRSRKRIKGSKTWRTKSKLRSVPFEIFYGIGVCIL